MAPTSRTVKWVVLTGARSRLADRRLHAVDQHPRRQESAPSLGPRQVQHRLSAAEAVALARAYQAGATMYELAVQFGVHRTTVATTLRKLGIPLRRQGLHGTELQDAIGLYGDGWSLARLGERFGCDAETVRQALKRSGVHRRGAHER